jgi:hypothetical protein
MYTITPFAPKIVERGPDTVQIFNTFEEYVAGRITWRTAATAYHECQRCHLKFNHAAHANATLCYQYVRVFDTTVKRRPDESRGEFMDRRYRVEKVQAVRHRLTTFAKVTTELGDGLQLDVNPEHLRRRTLRSTESWMASRISPIYRGMLDVARNTYLQQYKHYTEQYLLRWNYRHPKTMNERRQAASATVDELAPAVRGRRTHHALPNSWNDRSIWLEKTWKKKKVKKQWMINIF